MNLKIKLKNPKYCNGCPFLSGLMEENSIMVSYCYWDNKTLGETLNRNKIKRPERCIEENGN